MGNLNGIELFLIDMDGTICLGDTVIDGAFEFVSKIKKTGRNYIYLTNNSSLAGKDYVKKLRALGFPCADDEIFTSGMATALYLNEKHAGERVFLVGTKAFEEELAGYGIDVSYDGASGVVCGFDRELTYEKLEKAVRLLRRGAKFIAANPDFVCPMPDDDVLPDCGSICALLTAACGVEPIYIGKPNRNLVDIISRDAGVPVKKIATIGDRLYTDMMLAKNSGCVSILVMSGETTKEMLGASPYKPDFVFPSVKELEKLII